MPGPGNAGTEWNAAGTILFSAGGGAGQIYSVAATGGEPKLIMPFDKARGEANQHMPQFLPDGRRFLFLLGGNEKVQGVYVASLDSPADRRQVTAGWVRHVYASGHLLFVRDGTLLALRFDPEHAVPSGEPVTIATTVAAWSSNPGMTWFAASPVGHARLLFGRQRDPPNAARMGGSQGPAARHGGRARDVRPDRVVTRRAKCGDGDHRRRGAIRPVGDGRRARRRRAASPPRHGTSATRCGPPTAARWPSSRGRRRMRACGAKA